MFWNFSCFSSYHICQNSHFLRFLHCQKCKFLPLKNLCNFFKKRPNSFDRFLKTGRAITMFTLPLNPPNANVLSNIHDHNSLCLSLKEQLTQQGLISSSQQMNRRFIKHCSSVVDAISVVNFATAGGLDLDLGSYEALIKNLVESGQPQLAKSLYCDKIIGRGIDPDPSILNSMVICFCELGKLEEARTHFDRLIVMDRFPCKAACCALLRKFYAQERFLEAFDYFVRIGDAGMHLGFWFYNVLTEGLCKQGYLDEAIEVIDKMRERTGLTPTLHLFKSLFYGLCGRGRVVEAELVFREMESHGFLVDKMMYNSLMNEYCKDKKMEMAMRVYFRMLKMGCEPDSYTYNTLIHGFVKMSLFDKGWVLCNQMTERGMQPSMVTYHTMINNYCKQGKVDCALRLLNHMVRNNLVPSVHCYTFLIVALYKENRPMEIDELFKNMVDNGVVPNHAMFFILLKMFPKGHELQLALVILHAIAKNGCGFDPSTLSTSSDLNPTRELEQEIELLLGEIVRSNLDLANVAYSIFISALCEGGKPDVALLCIDKMVNFGCSPLIFAYNSLIKCLCRKGLFEDAKPLIDLLQDRGMVPDMATCSIMVSEHCKQGDLASAVDILDQMDERGLKPSSFIYGPIIGRLCREKRMFEAEAMFKRMLEANVDLDEVVYMTMINGYSKNGRAIEACQLFEKMIESSIKPSSCSYTALISGLVKEDMIDVACMYVEKMLGNGVVPDVVLYTSLIKQFLEKGEFDFAFRLVDLMDRNQIEHNVIMYIALVNGICSFIAGRKRWCFVNRRSERAREMLFRLLCQRIPLPGKTNLRVSVNSPEEMKCFVLKLLQKVKKTRFIPNLYIYNSIISGFCWADRMQDAYDHFELMQREGIHPNRVTFTILIGGHIREGEIDHAIGLFNKMNADGCNPDILAYNTLLKGLCQAGRSLDALSLLHAMHKRGFFTIEAYEKLLRCFYGSDLNILAFKIFEDMIF